QTANVVVRNPTGYSGSMVVSAVDEGILMIDQHSIGDPSDWFSESERLAVSWWNGLGRCGAPYWHEESQECRTTEGLLGEFGGSGSGGIGALGAGGSGRGVATRGRLKPRTFLEANPMAWTSPVLPLVPGDQTVTIPMGAYTGQVRVSAVAVSGMQATVVDTGVPVRAPMELKVSGPLVVAPGDTFEVVTSLLAKPGTSASMELSVDGAATPLDTLLWGQVLTGTSRADHRIRLVATSTGVIRILSRAVDGSDTGYAPLAVEAKDDRNQSADVHQEGLPGKGRERGGSSGQAVIPSSDGQLLTFALDDRFLPDGLSVRLEATTNGVLGMDRRPQELIGYPHGCLEQTLSRAIPQLYLAELFPEMSPVDREKARMFTEAAVAKLRTFQKPSGMLSLWPTEPSPHEWGSLWALDFLQEYQHRFPTQDHSLRDALQNTMDTIRFQDPLMEAYRLALRNRDKSGARTAAKILDSLEHRELRQNARWMIARAWWRLGEKDRARAMATKASAKPDTTTHRWGMGSNARDRALELEVRSELGQDRPTDSLIKLVAADLASPGWATTHELGAQFRALAKALGAGAPPEDSIPRIRYGKSGWKPLPLVKGRAILEVPAKADTIQLKLANAKRNLSVEVTRRGRLKDPFARRDSGLALRMDSLPQGPVDEGAGFNVQFLAQNRTSRKLTDLSATLWLPGGWAVPRAQLQSLRQGWRHVDIRADRVVFHFDLGSGQSRTVRIPLVALQAGSYMGPEVRLEALYDGDLFAGWKGKRVKIEHR
ncbi:MAG TPA: hypothetical protein PKY05_07930, partial [Fibrobacteria bacterium]|nr:hypothetical protein [Fibrobacteria bacterium]